MKMGLGRGLRGTGVMAAAMLAASAGLWCAAPAKAQVAWRSGPTDQPRSVGRAQLATKLQRLSPTVGVRRVVVRLDQVPTEEEKSTLAANGMRLLDYLGDNAYFATLSPRASLNTAGIAATGRVFNADVIERDWKLHPDLARDIVRDWTIVQPGVVDENASPEERAKADPIVGVYVMVHEDADLEAMATKITAEYQGHVRSRLAPIHTLVVEMPASQIKMLAEVDEVQWMEPPLPAFSELNLEARPTVQADLLEAAPYNLTGAGVKVMVFDGGRVRGTHTEFSDGGPSRVTYGADAADALSDHSTHVAGTIGGDGNGGTGEKGMAPGVEIISYAFEQPGGLSQGFLYTDPGDLQSDYNEAINTYGADLANNSIGTNTESNGYPCEWQGQYGVTDALIDSIARGSLGAPFRIFWAAGNERQGSRCDTEGFGDYYSVAPPSAAKNHMSIGATNSWENPTTPGASADTMTSFSSWGPADDGRMKPDFCAPGCQSTGTDTGLRSAGSASDTTYTVKCGTSMATPVSTGVGALILQDYRAQFPSEPDPRGSTMKVLLAHTAVDLGLAGPDYQFGYGRIRAKDAVDFMRTGNFTEGSVSQGSSTLMAVIVQPGDPELRVTLAWDDAPGVPNSAVNLVNDLDLVVTAPGGQRFYPWTLNPAVPTAAAVQNAENHRDNLEQVLVANPAAGAWLVEIRGTAVPQGPQSFSVGASPFLVNCSDQGVAAFNGEGFNCNSLASFKVVDCGLNTDDNVIDTVTVHVSSTSDVGFDMLLSESAPAAATFVGSVQLSPTPGGALLQVASGDTVTVTYIDADNGSGGSNVVVTDTAVVDCTSPVISNVAVSGITYNSAIVTFTTNETAGGSVRFGTTCGSFGAPVVGSSTTSHSLALTGLTDGTSYKFEVSAVDPYGNTATDANGGFCFSFSTTDIPSDYFTQLFTSGTDPNDMDNRQISFTPNGSAEFYSVCEDTIAILPVDATAHTPVAVGNDTAPVQLTLTGGETVKVFGRSYGSFWVNPSGNITFTASDTSVTESVSIHFNRDRLSLLFDDIDSTLAGASVKWAQLADRAVVTWTNVPEDGGLNPSTFQCEMFFSGKIRYSYLTIGQADGLIGISGGQGVGQTGGTPIGYVESNISGYGSCGPQPPSALGATAETAIGAPVSVTLTSYDDGLPAPPSLTYRVVSLPAQGTVSDPVLGPITAGSLPFALSGNSVNYAPPAFFQGQVVFQYNVDDGGTPPDGGVSNNANVTIVVGGPQVVYEFLVDNTNPGWTTMGQWAFGQPTGGQGSATGSFDPTSGYTGTNVYGYNLAGGYPNSLTPVQYLTSTAINLTDRTQITLEFRRWLGIESSTFDHANLQVSVDNVNWTTLYNHVAGSFSEQAWSLQSYSLSPLCDNQPTVYLRWGMGTTDTSVTYQGWNIDDIRIRALVPFVPPAECVADANGDNVVDAADLSVLLANFGQPAAGPAFGDFNNDGQCNGADLSVLLGSFGVPCS